MNALFCIRLWFVLLWSAGLGVAQAPAGTGSASSPGFFLTSRDLAPGAGTQSPSYAMTGCVGNGSSAQSTGYRLEGGFVAGLSVSATGRPWLTAASPRFATPRSAVTVSLHGAELDLGGNPVVTIGGVRATLTSRSQHTVQVTLPVQPAPGWQPIEVTNSGGRSILPQGIGILPMVLAEPAAAPGQPFRLLFKGRPNDRVLWALGIASASSIQIPGLGFQLGLNPGALLILPGFTILSASGEFHLPISASGYSPGTVAVQAAFLTSDPGYAPGSFSNVLRF